MVKTKQISKAVRETLQVSYPTTKQLLMQSASGAPIEWVVIKSEIAKKFANTPEYRQGHK